MQFEETVRGTFSGNAGGPIQSNTGTPNIRKPGHEHGRTASRAASDVSLKVVLPGIWRKSEAASCIFMSLVVLFPTSNSDIMLYVVHQHVVSAEGVHTFLSLTSINVHHDSGSKISLPRHSKNLRWHESALWRRQPAKHLQAHDIGWDFSSSFQSLRSLFTLSVLNSGIEQIIPVNPLSFINAILQPIPKCL